MKGQHNWVLNMPALALLSLKMSPFLMGSGGWEGREWDVPAVLHDLSSFNFLLLLYCITFVIINICRKDSVPTCPTAEFQMEMGIPSQCLTEMDACFQHIEC